MKKDAEQLEFAISQYIDGTLDEGARTELEGLLAKDPDLQVVLEGHQNLTELLRSVPAPEVRWDSLSEAISLAIDEDLESRARRASWWIQFRVPVGLAAAASIILVVGIWLHYLVGPKPTPTPNAVPTLNALIVQGPEADKPQGRQIADVSIGPGGSYAKEPQLAPYMDQIDIRPARVLMASGITPQQPTGGSPF